MRIYVPTTFDRLRGWYDSGVLASPVAAYAATESVRQTIPDIGDDEAEYAIVSAAAEASQQLLTDDFHEHGRRVVVVAEMPYASVESDPDHPGAVTVVAPIEREQISAALADGHPVALSGHLDDLSWFATQEIPQLLASSAGD
ncbi:MAG: hypothetical protein WAK18_01080 [Nocardioidaceae bacterium]